MKHETVFCSFYSQNKVLKQTNFLDKHLHNILLHVAKAGALTRRQGQPGRIGRETESQTDGCAAAEYLI